MKKITYLKKTIIAGVVAASMFLAPLAQIPVQAYEIIATVTGTVNDKTTSEILFLKTSDGMMEIKMDSNTNTSACKMLMPGTKVDVSVYHGGDEYLHADTIKLSGDAQTSSLDMSTQATVSGKIKAKTTTEKMYLEMDDGTMEIKLDPSTDYSGVTKMLLAGDKATVKVARGNDAYMHAISVSNYGYTVAVTPTDVSTTNTAGTTTGTTDTTTGTTESTSGTTTGTTGNGGQDLTATAVSGVAGDSTKADMLYLVTDSGTMELKIDASTTTANGALLTKSNRVTAYVYRGNDAYMHAVRIVGKSGPRNATLSGNEETFTGVISASSDCNTLNLATSGGNMPIKLDAATTYGTVALISGKTVTVKAQVGDDEYWHALSVQ